MLELQGVKKTFNPGTPDAKCALDGVTLRLAEGDFACLIGSNGAGKSTLLAAVSGEFFPDEGRVLIDGEDVTFTPDYRRSRVIGRLFQDPMRGTAPHMTIEENLSLAYMRASGRRPLLGMTGRAERAMFREKLAQLGLGLEERMRQPVGLLSGGQRQALTLLMATLTKPKLLLLDEHTAALDPATAAKVMDLTKRIAAEGRITCLMVTHNIEDALKTGSRTLMMDAGRIVLDIAGGERRAMTVEKLVERFKQSAGEALTDDRLLLAK